MTNSALLDIYASGQSVSSPPAPDGCAQIFAPCLDIHCERPCGARRTTPEINLDIARERHTMGFWTLAALCLALVIIFIGAAAYGLPKEEHAYQVERT